MTEDTDDQHDDASGLGKRLLEDIVGNLESYAGKSESQQQAIIDHLREGVAEAIREAQRAAYAGDYPACPATLEGASIKGQITARITIPKQAVARHSLLDAVGSTVILVIANPEAYLEGIKDIKARAKQRDLFPAAQRPLDIGLDKVEDVPDVGQPAEPEDPRETDEANWVGESYNVDRNVITGTTRVSRACLGEALVDKLADYNARTDVQSIGFNAEEIRKQTRSDILLATHWLDAYVANDEYQPIPTAPSFLQPPASR